MCSEFDETWRNTLTHGEVHRFCKDSLSDLVTNWQRKRQKTKSCTTYHTNRDRASWRRSRGWSGVAVKVFTLRHCGRTSVLKRDVLYLSFPYFFSSLFIHVKQSQILEKDRWMSSYLCSSHPFLGSSRHQNTGNDLLLREWREAPLL